MEWEYSNELNVGAEGLFLHNRLSTEINYFRELRKNIIGVNNAKYAATGGDFIPYENIGEVMNQGFDAYVSWNDKIGKDFTYNVGFNITYTKNKLRKSNELSNMEEYRKAIGRRPARSLDGRHKDFLVKMFLLQVMLIRLLAIIRSVTLLMRI